ncbi:LysR substrate-binding domain-containing protein [Vibrio vulnificus]|uniref:LysR substrate-binding domain-containing protein n=1 Tax=Vibrio vulnificus TaxID=672 RepID=UPI0030ED92A0
MTTATENSSKITMKMLRYFYQVAKHKHFGRAAKHLNISNSPLSAQIKELEIMIGSPLFIRDTRSVELTNTGILLFEECHTIFKVFDGSIQKVIEKSRSEEQTINVGLISSFFWAGLGEALRTFKDKYPDYNFRIFEMTPEEQKSSLEKKLIDVGLVRFADTINTVPLITVKLIDDEMCLVVSNNHRFKDRKIIGIEEIKDENFIFMQRQDSASSKLIVDTFLSYGYHIHVEQEVYEPNTLVSIVASSNLISVVPTSFSKQKWNNIHFIKLRERLPAHLCALYSQQNDNIALRSFTAHIKQELEQFKNKR